jgi:YesN/AraC family two-component response regulator
LIVEDNPELLQYLCDTLVPEYRILSAQNGKEALIMAKEKNPAIIITDVMMPVMSGFDLCKLLKEETITSHIPIIMLSAATNSENKLKGLQVGADVFIEKPFDIEFLSLQIKNLLKAKEEARKSFKSIDEPQTLVNEQPSRDNLFLNKAIEIVTKNIGNPDFNVDAFAKEMGYSRTVCYSKIKALSDLSINEFILTLRLKHAAIMLKNNNLSVNEISFQVGFNDPNYFNTCFKRYYNVPPKTYAKGREI